MTDEKLLVIKRLAEALSDSEPVHSGIGITGGDVRALIAEIERLQVSEAHLRQWELWAADVDNNGKTVQ